MSAILSADDLNDFISPGVACIKPIETLPAQKPEDGDPYEVTTEDKIAASNPPPAQISLTDCLACSGCVTSAEAVLVSLQSHVEVLNTLDAHRSLPLPWEQCANSNSTNGHNDQGKIFVASISPQSRASLAALYNISSTEADRLIRALLSGPDGLASTTTYNRAFSLVLDTNVFREIALVKAAEETLHAASAEPKKPILTSACPGWICYAEKTHPHVLPHLSRLKSPQALAGTFVKSLLWKRYGISPDRVWHMAVMPCFDKKLEASRAELTSALWDGVAEKEPVRDVDCVITVRELVNMADARGISLPSLLERPRRLKRQRLPDAELDEFLFPRGKRRRAMNGGERAAGTSGGYLWHILSTVQASQPGSRIESERGRNADVIDYRVTKEGQVLFKAARYYGFRNIQNLVRRLKPAKASRLPGAARRPGGGAVQTASDYGYVEVMACPGGCTNGGGQIKAADLGSLAPADAADQETVATGGVADQRKWLNKVDEAYWSASSDTEAGMSDDEHANEVDVDAMEIDEPSGVNGMTSHDPDRDDMIDGISTKYVRRILRHWSEMTGTDEDVLIYTTYRAVESDVGKNKAKGVSDVERVAGLASSLGGGW